MRTINAADLCRQIRREGRRLGLVPKVEDGRVFVAEKVRRPAGRGIAHVVVEAEAVASVSMDNPISNIGRLRRKRWEQRGRLARLRAAQAKRRAAADAAKAEVWQAYRGDLDKARRQLGADEFLRAMRETLRGGFDVGTDGS
jgi:hypothetical protein